MQEELDLKPGHSFLDVGSGCGIIAACAAYLVSLLPVQAALAQIVNSAVQSWTSVISRQMMRLMLGCKWVGVVLSVLLSRRLGPRDVTGCMMWCK